MIPYLKNGNIGEMHSGKMVIELLNKLMLRGFST